jgi:hypothetical protein
MSRPQAFPSLPGGVPNSRLYSRLNWEGLRPTILDLGVLTSVLAASACHQHTSYVLLSIHSVIERLSGAS